MLPTLAPGDRLLVRRTRSVGVGELVVVADPRRPDRWIVKRVAARGADGALDVRGDAAASTDSRTFGRIAPAHVVGRPVYRYAPASRTGRLGGR